MELNKLFDMIENTRSSASWRAAFGEPEIVDDKTIIPVAQVTYGFGMGFGTGTELPEEDALQVEGALPADEASAVDLAEGAGGGGGSRVKPLGALVITPEGVEFEETVDSTKVALAVFMMIAWSTYQLTKTLRAIFGRK